MDSCWVDHNKYNGEGYRNFEEEVTDNDSDDDDDDNKPLKELLLKGTHYFLVIFSTCVFY